MICHTSLLLGASKESTGSKRFSCDGLGNITQFQHLGRGFCLQPPESSGIFYLLAAWGLPQRCVTSGRIKLHITYGRALSHWAKHLSSGKLNEGPMEESLINIYVKAHPTPDCELLIWGKIGRSMY